VEKRVWSFTQYYSGLKTTEKGFSFVCIRDVAFDEYQLAPDGSETGIHENRDQIFAYHYEFSSNLSVHDAISGFMFEPYNSFRDRTGAGGDVIIWLEEDKLYIQGRSAFPSKETLKDDSIVYTIGESTTTFFIQDGDLHTERTKFEYLVDPNTMERKGIHFTETEVKTVEFK